MSNHDIDKLPDFFYYYWGPFLARTKLPDDLINNMREDSYAANEDYRTNLAGQIKNEYKFDENILQKYSIELAPYIEKYFLLLTHTWKSKFDEEKLQKHRQYVFDSMWVNFQKKNEYNPLHNHAGDISFVIYPDIPDCIAEEENITTAPAAGSITFVSGINTIPTGSRFVQDVLQPIQQVHHKPVTGEMFIFPSYLLHHVIHFSSDVTRVSISGNVFLEME